MAKIVECEWHFKQETLRVQWAGGRVVDVRPQPYTPSATRRARATLPSSAMVNAPRNNREQRLAA